MKRFLSIVLAAIMALGILAGCGSNQDPSSTGSASGGSTNSSTNSMEGAYVFMAKESGTTFTEHMFYGFKTALEALDPNAKAVDRSPEQFGVTYQITGMEECLAQNIAALCISTFAETGFDAINEKYKEAGIPIFSADSKASEDYRVTHFNQASSEELGRYYLWSSILASQKIDIQDYSGDAIQIGLISSTPDSPVQLSWHAGIDAELEDPIYKDKIVQTIKYGNDDVTDCANQLNAFLSEGIVDVVFCMSGISETVAQAAYDSGNEMKVPVVGLALCSNAYNVLPDEDQDTYGSDVIMPWAMLWDLQLNGFVAGAGMYAYVQGDFDGKEGSSFKTPVAGRFSEEMTKTAVQCATDNGTEVICGLPVIFSKYNKEEWKDLV